MKAVAVFPGSREVKVVDDQDEPQLSQPDDVMLRLLDVGICGTDKEICNFEYGTPPPGDDHLVIGHEALAEVVACGSAVTRVQPGDLVFRRCVARVLIPVVARAEPGTRTTATPATSASAASKSCTAI